MAATGRPDCITRLAGADLSPYLYHIMGRSAARTVNLATGTATASGFAVGPTGVLYSTAPAGAAVALAVLGPAKVIAGDSIAEGRAITCNGSGRAVAAASGDIAFGHMLEAVGADGDYGEVFLCRPFRLIGAN